MSTPEEVAEQEHATEIARLKVLETYYAAMGGIKTMPPDWYHVVWGLIVAALKAVPADEQRSPYLVIAEVLEHAADPNVIMAEWQRQLDEGSVFIAQERLNQGG